MFNWILNTPQIYRFFKIRKALTLRNGQKYLTKVKRFFLPVDLKGCVRYIFACLFFMCKGDHF